MAGRTVVGVTGSAASLAALRTAADEARHGGRRLVAVLAWEPPEGEAAYLRRPDRAWAAYWEEEAQARLRRAFDEVFGGAPPGVETEHRVVRARPWRALLAAAPDPDDRLVVGAGRGFGGGRVGRRLRRGADCAVLTVPKPRLTKETRRALRRATPTDFARSPVGA
ncbi:universal stress protein [Streptomyces sp. NBC_01304]|uniref:universal stress protein n=1 Tax=Streptomyces sp. NBC_01304 TaxID=2903818 RepID=UPI002E0DB682|nr:universal stress protein [Streptomyces sp. NBC_01304]